MPGILHFNISLDISTFITLRTRARKTVRNTLVASMNYTTDKYKEGNPIFCDWLIKQADRDDLIGDIALDTKKNIEEGLLSKTSSFKNIWTYIKETFDKHNFFIQDTDAQPDKKRLEIEKQLGVKLHNSYANSVSPLLCLQLAWDEYENYIIRKKFILKIKNDSKKIGYVYFIGLKDHDKHVKIGFSSDNNFIHRQKTIENASPYDTFLIGYIQSENYVSLENELHKRYNDSRIKREWFNIPYSDIQQIIKEYNGIFNNASH